MKTKPEEVFINDFDYPLPTDRIALFPLQQRDSSKLLVAKNEEITDTTFSELSSFLPTDAHLVLNNTKVIEARIFFQKESGGVIEIFCLEPFEPAEMSLAMLQTEKVQWHCLIGGASKWKHGLILEKEILIGDKKLVLKARYISKLDESFIVEFSWDGGHTFADILHMAGAIPLPPYIKRKAEKEDAERYQTVFAEHHGSVAAPTAALHFTNTVFTDLSKKNIHPLYLTLHVGAGTFKPVKSETIAGHQMHGESFSVSKKTLEALISAETIIAVGTTSLRTLESLYWLGVKKKEKEEDNLFLLHQWEAYELPATLSYKESLAYLLDHLEKNGEDNLVCRTSLLIMPGYQFKSAKALITNFHQPRSTLLLLVAAFYGEGWKRVYEHALEKDYRFLSYGDSSLLWRKDV